MYMIMRVTISIGAKYFIMSLLCSEFSSQGISLVVEI